MTVHKSLKAGGMVKHRNVFTRIERMLKLQKDDRWKDGESVLGLPKTKVPPQVGKKKKKTAAETAAEGTAAPAAAAAAAAAPAPAAAPAKNAPAKNAPAKK